MKMSVARLLRGYSKLSEEDKKELESVINQYDNGSTLEKSSLLSVSNEIVNFSKNVGPKDSICFCCGR